MSKINPFVIRGLSKIELGEIGSQKLIIYDLQYYSSNFQFKLIKNIVILNPALFILNYNKI